MVVFDAVHHATFTGVDLQNSLSVIAWWHCFDGKTFPTSGPFCLCKCGLADDLAGLEEVAISIARKCTTFSLSNHFDIFRNIELEVCHLKILQVKTAGVVITKLDVVTEVRWSRDWQMHQSLMIHCRNNMLLLGKKWHVSVADLCGSGEEVPVLCNLGAGAAIQAALGVSRASQSAVHDAPLAINNDSVPPMVWAGHALHVQNLSRTFEIAADDLRVQTNSVAHIAYKNGDLLTATTLGLDDPSWIGVAFVVFFPSDAFGGPCENSS